MTYDTIRYEQRDQVGWITLNRPAVFNALNLRMAQELSDVAIRCDEDATVRCVVVTGAGKAFFAGGDLAEFATRGEALSATLKQMTMYLHAAISRLVRMEKPLIAAVNGIAAGAGFSFMLPADLAIAARSAKFTLAYTRAGLSPDGSSTYFLARTVGLRRAQELVLTNRTLSAEEALDWGLITRVVDDAALLGEVETLAKDLASGPTKAYAAARHLMRAGLENGLETQMELETRAIADMGRSADGREGIAAFVAKRKPNFIGS